MRALFFTLILAFSLSAHASCDPELRTPEHSLSGHLHRLMNQSLLLQQLDCKLGARGLIIPDGGLCVSTSGVNVLHAMYNYVFGRSGRLGTHSDEQVEKIVTEIKTTFKQDARDGTSLTFLAGALRFAARDLNLRITAENFAPGKAGALTIADLNPGDDELIIASVRQGLRKNQPGFHAIVITSANPGSRVVTYSDPNFPNFNNRVHAMQIPDPRGTTTVRLNIPRAAEGGEHDGIVHDILRIRIHGKQDAHLTPEQLKKSIGAFITLQFTSDAPDFLAILRDRPVEVLELEESPSPGALVVSYEDSFKLRQVEKIPVEYIRMYHVR